MLNNEYPSTLIICMVAVVSIICNVTKDQLETMLNFKRRKVDSYKSLLYLKLQ